MNTITLTYQQDNVFAQKILDALLASGVFNIRKTRKKSEWQKSWEEAEKGNYFVAQNAHDAINQCLA
jgi:hypothetical protein